MTLWQILWRKRKVAVLLNALTAIIFIPAFTIGWALMKDTGKEQLYGLVSDSLIATMAVSLLYAAPMATLYWLNATEPTAHLVKRLLGASLLMLGVIGGCETLIALFSFYVDTSRTDLWAHTLTSVAINPHGFFLIRVLVTVALVVLVLIAGFPWIHRQRS